MATPALVRKLSAVETLPQRSGASIAAAVRTLDLEGEGIASLKAALDNGLGAPFAQAVEISKSAAISASTGVNAITAACEAKRQRNSTAPSRRGPGGESSSYRRRRFTSPRKREAA